MSVLILIKLQSGFLPQSIFVLLSLEHNLKFQKIDTIPKTVF